MIISGSVLPRMRNISDILTHTHFMLDKGFIFFKNHTVYEIMWKNIVEPERPQMAVWCMRFADWIAKATNTNSEYVFLVLLLTATIFA